MATTNHLLTKGQNSSGKSQIILRIYVRHGHCIRIQSGIWISPKRWGKKFAQRFSYHPLDLTAQTSIFTEAGDFKTELAQGFVGTSEDLNIKRSKDNYLYDMTANSNMRF